MLGDQIQRVAKQPLLPARRSARLQEKIDRVQCVLEETEPQPDHILLLVQRETYAARCPSRRWIIRGKAHPLVTCASGAKHKAFQTFQRAKQSMSEMGITLYMSDVTSDSENTTPLSNHEAFYAVAYGRKPGIKPYYKCVCGSLLIPSMT